MDAKYITKTARGFLKKKYPFLPEEDLDEFSQFVILDRLKTGKKRDYQYIALDFLRKKRNKGGRGSKDAMAFTIADGENRIHSSIDDPDPEYWEKKIKIDEDTPMAFRIILLLVYQWGMTGEDIAWILGLTPGRVSQLFKEALSHQKLGVDYAKRSGISKKLSNQFRG